VQITLTSSGVGSTFAIASQPSLGVVTLNGDVVTYTPNWGTAGVDSFTVTVSGPGGTSAPTPIYVTVQPPPLPEGPGSYTGPAIPESGPYTALCPTVGSVIITGAPGPPTGTAYDPNWCEEQVLTIAQQLAQLQNQQTQLTNLQTQVAAQEKLVQSLGTDTTTAQLATVNANAAKILAQATGIGFNQASAGAAFAAAYPASSTVSGFNNQQLAAALATWQANTAAALNSAVQVQNAVAQARPTTTAAVANAVAASNSAVGATGAIQATNQLLATVNTQLAQLQDILISEGQAETAVSAAQSAAPAAAVSAVTTAAGQVQTTITAAPGVTDADTL
jgi:P-type conjugative transfer protein TrbJ